LSKFSRGETEKHWYREHLWVTYSCFGFNISAPSQLVCGIFEGE